ncbi:hypothetical protein [Microbacterium jejuense]|uniref:hypothetical protein n=1 Tax=Microbacterium jejuense TaxID=1263637 RepID=UPI0031EC28EA
MTTTEHAHYLEAPETGPSSLGRSTATDWADEWWSRLLRDSRRRSRAVNERFEHPWDQPIRAAAEYDAETDNLLKFIRRQEAS